MTDDYDTNLDFVTTDALVEELKRRCVAGVVALAYAEEGGELFRVNSWGSMFWRRGVTETMAERFSEMSDTLMNGPAEQAESDDD